MICPNYPTPSFFVFTDQVPALLYYSHLPAMFISLLIGTLVFFKSEKSLLGRILLAMSITFFLWSFINLIAWTSNSTDIIAFIWPFFGTIYALLYIFSLYFAKVFVSGRDISFNMKFVLGVLFLPIVLLAPTRYNVQDFNLALCGVTNERSYYLNYFYGFGFFVAIWVLFILISGYRKSEGEMKKQILLFGFGIEAFLLSFFVAGYLASVWFENMYSIEFYGLLGMTFFMGVLTYLIVKFKAFNVKLLGVQALVFSLIILIGSQFAFIKNSINIVLNGITLTLIMIFGYFLVRSVKKEIEQKEQLATVNAELSQRKDELQMISDRLAQSNDKLRTLDNAKTEFISIASHQLRTPPTAIKGYASLIAEESFGPINEKQKEALKKISQANDQQINFVEDLLNVSRIESGRMEYSFKEWDIQDLCQNVVDNLYFKAKENKLYLDYKKSETEIPKVAIDGAKVLEVISNMVDNALKYTQRGGVTMRVSLCEKNTEGCIANEHVRIVVSDTGIGIPDTELPYLFAKFSRGKDISRLNTGGTGLGLYVGKIMIEANGGKIWAESDGKDKGSRFIIELPVTQTEENLRKVG